MVAGLIWYQRSSMVYRSCAIEQAMQIDLIVKQFGT